ncbi:MAG TPA: endolytic transglycosylase MltG [Pyrinomonadaceae bacterium]|nr:endolytic transglycosylase MltG [Pyrinomonadaceae bacterium]
MRRFRLILIILVLLLSLAGLAAFWAYRELHAPVEHAQAEAYIEIPRGSSTDQIISRLDQLGVIRRGWLLRLYIRLAGAGPRLKAGEYRFPSPISPAGVLRKLEEGEQRLSRLTVPEGWTRWDIAGLLARIPELKLSGTAEALALLDDPTPIRDLDPAAPNLEGYLFPDTYSFPPDSTAREVVNTMVRRFRQVWAETTAKHALPPGRTPREIVTVASLVETEAKLKEERPLVASVIYNRLSRGIPLGIDSSVIYASKLAGKWRNDGKVYLSDLERDSPYNTRKVRGLPPGPIASPGQRSLEAALAPAQTDYLYYVREPSRDDGAHNFYENEADFGRGVQALREWERARNANVALQPAPTPATSATPAPAESPR